MGGGFDWYARIAAGKHLTRYRLASRSGSILIRFLGFRSFILAVLKDDVPSAGVR
jgi:hypothetical protein